MLFPFGAAPSMLVVVAEVAAEVGTAPVTVARESLAATSAEVVVAALLVQ
jgi:hypothetical protein